jgi:hypothetical protein
LTERGQNSCSSLSHNGEVYLGKINLFKLTKTHSSKNLSD